MLPFPDNFFFAPTWDATAPPALTLQNGSLPIDSSGNPIDPDFGGYNALQGFSPLGPVMAYLPGLDLDASRLPRLWSIPTSAAAASSNSVMLRADTLEPVLHWVELDHSGDDGGTALYERSLLLWPAARLADATRYIVAFRNLTDAAGVPVAPSDTLDRVSQLADEVVCLQVPAHFRSVGQFYRDFPQVEEEEVIRILSAPQ